VRSIAFTPDGRMLASGDTNTTVLVWDVSSGQLLYTLNHEATVNSVAFRPDGTILAAAGNNGVRMWDMNNQQLLLELKASFSIQRLDVTFSPDGRLLATATGNEVQLWDTVSGNPLGELAGHTDEVSAVGFSPDGRILASASKDGTIQLWGAKP